MRCRAWGPGEPIPLHQALHLLVGAATDHNQVLELLVEAGLDHERGVHHRPGQRTGSFQPVELLQNAPHDFRMHQSIQLLQAAGSLNTTAQAVPVDFSVRIQNAGPEGGHHRIETGLPLPNQAVGDAIGVDHPESVLGEPVADR